MTARIYRFPARQRGNVVEDIILWLLALGGLCGLAFILYWGLLWLSR